MIVLSTSDAVIPAVAAIAGAIIGGGIVWLVEWQRLDRERRAAARILGMELLAIIVILEAWIKKNHWWLSHEHIYPPSWIETRAPLCAALSKSEWLTLAQDMRFLQIVEEMWEDNRHDLRDLSDNERATLADAVKRTERWVARLGSLS